MARARALRRLSRVQQLREEQAQAALQRAVGELQQLEQLRRAALERARAGRRLIAGSVVSGERIDWVAGQEEARLAGRLGTLLKFRIAESEKDVAEAREALLARRIERRQTESLLEQAEARTASESARRAQQSTDEWFLDRRRVEQSRASLSDGTGRDSCAVRKS